MAEKEYIEREAVAEMLENAQMITDGEYCGYCTEDVCLDNIPTDDVVEVVRCSNCIHICLHSSGYYYCSVTGKEYKGYELGYHFCSYGKSIDKE